MQKAQADPRPDQTHSRAAANHFPFSGLSMPAVAWPLSGNPIQRIIIDGEGKKESDDVIEKAIAHLPEEEQDEIWKIHRAPKLKMTLDKAFEMVIGGEVSLEGLDEERQSTA